MLDRTSFARRFGRKAVFGMVHLLPLPGAPLFGGSMDAVLARAHPRAPAPGPRPSIRRRAARPGAGAGGPSQRRPCGRSGGRRTSGPALGDSSGLFLIVAFNIQHIQHSTFDRSDFAETGNVECRVMNVENPSPAI